MKIELIATRDGCMNLTCPRIYKTDKGSFIVQGQKVSQDLKRELSIPENEEAIEIPMDLIDTLIRKIG